MPYQEHSPFKTPPEQQIIWRYMSFDKFLWVLKQSKIHFHRVGDFEDRFEGTIPKALMQQRNQQIREQNDTKDLDDEDRIRASEISTQFTQRTVFANCWHANERESAAMWNQYEAAGRPIAIKTTVGDLISSFEPIERAIYIGSISYVDFYSEWEELSADDRRKLNNLYKMGGLDLYFRQLS